MSNDNQPGRSKLLPLFLVVNVLFLAAILAAVLLRPQGGVPAPAAEDRGADPRVAPGPGPTFRLPDLTVHLRNPEADRYARIGLEFELFAEEDRAVITAHLPMIRDAFLAWFSDRTVEELHGSEGLARSKAALLGKLEELVPGRRIRALYITDFVVQ